MTDRKRVLRDKYLPALMIALLLYAGASAQGIYQTMANKYKYRAGRFDSTLRVPYGATPSLRESNYSNLPGAIFWRTYDSSFYGFTGHQWLKVGNGGGGGPVPTLQQVTFSSVGSAAGTAITSHTILATAFYTGGGSRLAGDGQVHASALTWIPGGGNATIKQRVVPMGTIIGGPALVMPYEVGVNYDTVWSARQIRTYVLAAIAGGGSGITGLTAGRIPVATSATTLSDYSGFTWNNSTTTLGITGGITMNANSTTPALDFYQGGNFSGYGRMIKLQSAQTNMVVAQLVNNSTVGQIERLADGSVMLYPDIATAHAWRFYSNGDFQTPLTGVAEVPAVLGIDGKLKRGTAPPTIFISNTIKAGYDSLLHYNSGTDIQTKALKLTAGAGMTQTSPTITDTTIEYTITADPDRVRLNIIVVSAQNAQVVDLTPWTGAYKEFHIKLIDVTPSADGDLSCQVSSGGVSFPNTSWQWRQGSSDNGTSTGTAAPIVLNRMEADANYFHNATVRIRNPHIVKYPQISWNADLKDWGGSIISITGTGYYTGAAQATSTLKFIMDGVKTFSGTIEIWGER